MYISIESCSAVSYLLKSAIHNMHIWAGTELRFQHLESLHEYLQRHFCLFYQSKIDVTQIIIVL